MTQETHSELAKETAKSTNSDAIKNGKPFKSKNNKSFYLTLVDIKGSNKNTIVCIRKDMYERDLKYIAISYRWGLVEERSIPTPEYTVRLTAFTPSDLRELCHHITREPDLKNIPYLWIDAISVDPNDGDMQKATMKLTKEIFGNATYILAVPDLNLEYLWENPANFYYLRLILTHKKRIYKNIFEAGKNLVESNFEKNKDGRKINESEIEMAYLFLKYLIKEWSNRTWVTLEYHIAKEKEEKDNNKPLKYIFLSLLEYFDKDNHEVRFFSHSFQNTVKPLDCSNNEDNKEQKNKNQVNKDQANNLELRCNNDFLNSLNEMLTNVDYLSVILNSQTSKIDNKINTILPLWEDHTLFTQKKNEILAESFENMTQIRIRLYEIMTKLSDKARLLYSCSFGEYIIRPTFASNYHSTYLHSIHKNGDTPIQMRDDNDPTQEEFRAALLNHLKRNGINEDNEEYTSIEKGKAKLYKDNVEVINLKKKKYLIVKVTKYFKSNEKIELKVPIYTSKKNNNSNNNDNDNENNNQDDDGPLFDQNQLDLVYLPFYVNSESKYFNIIPSNTFGIYLIGKKESNRWVVKCHDTKDRYDFSLKNYSDEDDDYEFTIY
ncbi:unnamed protein product [Cunninghamella blakesleeana]